MYKKGTVLTIRTLNSIYTVTMGDGMECIVLGNNQHCTEPTRMVLADEPQAGKSAMFWHPNSVGRYLITSTVQEVTIEEPK